MLEGGEHGEHLTFPKPMLVNLTCLQNAVFETRG